MYGGERRGGKEGMEQDGTGTIKDLDIIVICDSLRTEDLILRT